MKYLSLLFFVVRIEIIALLGVTLVLVFTIKKKDSSSRKFAKVLVGIVMGVFIWVGLSFLSVAELGKKGPGDAAKRMLSQMKLEKLASDYKQYTLMTGKSPSSLQVLVDCVGAAKGCVPVARQEDLLDGWDYQIQFKCITKDSITECELTSYGADNEIGGIAENADILKRVAS